MVALWGTEGLVVKATYEAGHFTEVSKGYHAVTCTISRDMDNQQLDSSGLADPRYSADIGMIVPQ